MVFKFVDKVDAAVRSPIIRVAASDTPVGHGLADFTCDGTDDQITLLEALETLPDSGGHVELFPGTYYISYELVIPQRLNRLIFSGHGLKTELLATNNDSNLGIIFAQGDAGDQTKRWTFRDFLLDGGGFVDNTGITADLLTECIIQNVKAENCKLGFYQNSTDGTVSQCYATNCERGIDLGRQSKAVNCIVRDCSIWGIGIQNGSQCMVIGCQVRNCTVGIRNDYNECTITGNTVIGPGTGVTGSEGIVIASGNNVVSSNIVRNCEDGIGSYSTGDVIIGNSIADIGRSAIISSSSSTAIVNNRIVRTSMQSDGTYDAIDVSASYATIIGNSFQGSVSSGKARYCINVTGANCFVSNNHTRVGDSQIGYVTGFLNDAGTGTVINQDSIAIDDRVSTATSAATSTWTYVAFNASSVRNDGGWVAAGGSDRLVVPETGWYQASATVGFQASTSGRRIVRIVTGTSAGGTTDTEIARQEVQQGSDGRYVANLSGIAYLTKGTEVGVAVWQSSGSTLTVGNHDCGARFGLVKVAA